MSTATQNKMGATFEIIERVATLEDTSPMDLPPLYDTIDPDRLEGLLESDGVTVTFHYCGYQVVVGSDDTLIITEDEEIGQYV